MGVLRRVLGIKEVHKKPSRRVASSCDEKSDSESAETGAHLAPVDAATCTMYSSLLSFVMRAREKLPEYASSTKLSRLSREQLAELCIDVSGEIERREKGYAAVFADSVGVAQHRAAAREKMAHLDDSVFLDLVTSVFVELERRNPGLHREPVCMAILTALPDTPLESPACRDACSPAECTESTMLVSPVCESIGSLPELESEHLHVDQGDLHTHNASEDDGQPGVYHAMTVSSPLCVEAFHAPPCNMQSPQRCADSQAEARCHSASMDMLMRRMDAAVCETYAEKLEKTTRAYEQTIGDLQERIRVLETGIVPSLNVQVATLSERLEDAERTCKRLERTCSDMRRKSVDDCSRLASVQSMLHRAVQVVQSTDECFASVLNEAGLDAFSSKSSSPSLALATVESHISNIVSEAWAAVHEACGVLADGDAAWEKARLRDMCARANDLAAVLPEKGACAVESTVAQCLSSAIECTDAERLRGLAIALLSDLSAVVSPFIASN